MLFKAFQTKIEEKNKILLWGKIGGEKWQQLLDFKKKSQIVKDKIVNLPFVRLSVCDACGAPPLVSETLQTFDQLNYIL